LFPYWLLFSVFAAGSLQYHRHGGLGRQENPLLLVAGLLVALMIGLRFEVGGDWATYETIFENIRYLDLNDAILEGDPGYSLLNWLAHSLGYDIWFVNLACAMIFTWGLVKFARRQPNPWLAILIAVPYLIIVVAMGYTRQAVAIGFVLAGLAAVDRTSLLRFSLYVLCAVAFHKSAIIVLPVVALAATNNRILTIALLFVLTLTLYFVFVASAVDDLITNYVEAQYQSEGAAVRVAMNLPPALIYLLFQRHFDAPPAQKKLWRNFSLAAIATLAALWLSASSTAVDRLALYLIPLQMFVLARLPSVFRGRSGTPNGQLTLAVIVYSAVIQFVWLNYATNAVYWVPYNVYLWI
jgi:hypothetical protein